MATSRTGKGRSGPRWLIEVLAGCAFVAGLTGASALASPRPWEVAPTRVPDACSAPLATANVPLTHGPSCTPTRTDTPTVTPTGTRPTATPTGTLPPATYTSTPTQVPTPGPCILSVSEDFEGGTLGIFGSGGTPGWSVVTTSTHSGIYAAFAPDVFQITDQVLTTLISVPETATLPTLSFWQRFDFDGGFNGYDGGVLEVSLNGSTWTDARFLLGGYNGIIRRCPSQNPLAGRAGWVSTSPGWVPAVVDLEAYRGRTILVRFRLGTDERDALVGWWIDDVSFNFSQPGCLTPTPNGTPPTFTRTPTHTRTSTPTFTPTITPSPTWTPRAWYTPTVTCEVVGGAITLGDPTQAGRLDLNGPVTSCLSGQLCPGIGSVVPHHYDAYAYTNSTSFYQCITITLDAASCTGNNAVYAAAYSTFDPANICSAYIGGVASSPGGSFSFEIPCCDRGHFTLVVSEVNPDAGCLLYRVTIMSDSTCSGRSTPTYTPTITRTPSQTPTSPGQPTGTPTNIPTDTPTNTPTNTPNNPPTNTPNNPPTGSPVPIITVSSTPCAPPFADVSSGDYFYEAVRSLFCRGVISGYGDATFRPYNLTTRGQLAKIIVLAEGWAILVPAYPRFTDVPATNPFYTYIETAYARGIISGYGCGSGCLEYRPANNITRGQLCKVVVLAEEWSLVTPAAPTFRDVPISDPFYTYIETAHNRGIISGYDCRGVPSGPCLEFRPGDNATRGQISKIIYGATAAP